MAARGKFEESDGTVSKTACEVSVGECEAPAGDGVRVTTAVARMIGGVEVENGMGGTAVEKVYGRTVPVDVFVAPRVLSEVGPAPDASCDALPQLVRA